MGRYRSGRAYSPFTRSTILTLNVSARILERLERDVRLAALDFADVRAVQAGLVGEDVLGPAHLLTQRPDSAAELFLDVLHQEQFGGTLLLSILVITS